jgi:hypothetical protein
MSCLKEVKIEGMRVTVLSATRFTLLADTGTDVHTTKIRMGDILSIICKKRSGSFINDVTLFDVLRIA